MVSFRDMRALAIGAAGSLGGRVHVLERSQRLELPAEQAFQFFTDAHNLESITPPWLDFNVATPGPIEMRPDALIEYRLKLRGVMVIPEPGAPLARYQEAKRLFDALKSEFGVDTLSMGMSDDYEIAVEEGATMVRVGRALFGERTS